MVRRRRFVLLVALSASACTSTSFTRTGFDSAPARQPGPCSAVVLEHPSTERKYVEIGFCTTSVPGGGVITDNTPKAIRELQECGWKRTRTKSWQT